MTKFTLTCALCDYCLCEAGRTSESDILISHVERKPICLLNFKDLVET
jgi:hypothetical protein